MKKINKAFTLIELLIVIALLGALAIGLLAALDPFEQLKKGTDTGIRNTVSELQGAIIRYYAVRGSSMPWDVANTPTTRTNVYSNYTTLGITNVINAGELKADFSTLAGNQLSNIWIMGTSESVTVCYKPTSRSFRSDSNTKYEETTFSAYSTNNETLCGNPATTEFHCMWCVK